MQVEAGLAADVAQLVLGTLTQVVGVVGTQCRGIMSHPRVEVLSVDALEAPTRIGTGKEAASPAQTEGIHVVPLAGATVASVDILTIHIATAAQIAPREDIRAQPLLATRVPRVVTTLTPLAAAAT